MRTALIVLLLWVAFGAEVSAQEQPCSDRAVDSVLVLSGTDESVRLDLARDIIWTEHLFSDPDRAYELAACIRQRAEAGRYVPQQADAINIQAISLGLRGNNPKAMELHLLCLKLRATAKDSAGMASSCNNIGNLYLAMGDLAAAYSNHTGSLAIRSVLNDSAGMAASLNNLGNVLLQQGRQDSAIVRYQASLAIKQRLGDTKGMASGYVNLGKVVLEKGMPDSAIALFNRGLAIYQERGDKIGMAQSLNNLALANSVKGLHGKTVPLASEALALATAAESIVVMRDAADLLQEAYAALNDHRRAYEMHVLFTSLRDSIVKEENQREVMRHQFQYDFDKKEAVLKAEQEARDAIAAAQLRQRELQRNSLIAFLVVMVFAGAFLFRSYKIQQRLSARLKEANGRLTRSEAELKVANDAKDRIFAILSHDLRSPIAQLSALVDLLRLDPDMDRSALDRMLGQAQVSLGHVLAMAENLLQWARLQLDRISPTTEAVDLGRLVPEVWAQLDGAAKTKDIRLESEVDATLATDPTIVGIALRNVMANAIRFSPNGGAVTVRLRGEDNRIAIDVCDQGSGFAQGTTTTGLSTKSQGGAGIGLHVSGQLLQLIGGRIEVTSKGSPTIVSVLILKA